MNSRHLIGTALAAALFALVFVLRGHVQPLRFLVRDERSLISFGAGMAAAYVFVHVMPELHHARSALTGAVSASLPYGGMSVYFVGLLGFLAFYGLEHVRGRAASAVSGEARAFRLHVGGFAAYVAIVAYLLVRDNDKSTSIALYAAAMAAHFLAVGHTLVHEDPAAYEARGRWVLAGAAIAGWLLGWLVALPAVVIVLLVAFLSGAVIINSAIMELAPGRDGRYLPFLLGGLVYGLLLLPLG